MQNLNDGSPGLASDRGDVWDFFEDGRIVVDVGDGNGDRCALSPVVVKSTISRHHLERVSKWSRSRGSVMMP